MRTFILAVLCVGTLAPGSLKAENEEWSFEMAGYYRLRGYYFNELDLRSSDVKVATEDLPATPEATQNADGDWIVPAGASNTAYTTQRLRLEPALRWGDKLGIFLSMDVLDDVLGGHQAASPAPLFAGTGSNHVADGAIIDTIDVKRVWVEYLTPVGKLVFGRTPSDFGMGLFSDHGGNGVGLSRKSLTKKWDSYFNEDFGDNYSSSGPDRILFATMPAGEDADIFMAVYYDHLVEGDINKGSDDVDDLGLALYYGPDADPETGDVVNGGFYMDNRRAYGTKSNVYILDLHTYIEQSDIYFEGEAVFLFGKSEEGGIPFTNNLKAEFGDVIVGAARLGYKTDNIHVRLEVGYGSGDDQLANTDRGGIPYPECNVEGKAQCKITTFMTEQDVNIGILMWDQVMPQKMGINDFAAYALINHTYVYPTVKYNFNGTRLSGLNLIGGLLWAKSNAPEMFRGVADDETDLGLEIDLGVQYYFSENFRYDLQFAYLIAGKGYPVVVPGADPDDAYGLINKFTVVF